MSKSLCDCYLGSQASVILAAIFRFKNRNLKEKGNAEDRIMTTTNFSSSRSRTKSFEELLCSPSLVGGFQQHLSICFLAVNNLLSITAFAGNSLILLSFTRNLPYIRRLNSCIVVWQPLICWLVLLFSLSVLHIGCPCFKNSGVFVDTQGVQATSQTMY